MENDNSFTSFTLKKKRGIDDLKGLYAFVGSWGQGDHYYSNDCSEHHPSYVEFVFDCAKTQEEVDKEVLRRKSENEQYISELKKQNRYGEEYEIGITFKKHPLFDDVDNKEIKLTSSFLMVNLNNNETKKD